MNILVIGPGLIGVKHIELVRQNPRCKLSAIVTLNAHLHQNFTVDFGIPVYENLTEAFEKHDFDAAIISTPNEVHYQHALACLEHKIPILIEKPLADTIERARDICAVADSLGVNVLVGHHRTYSTYIPEAKKILNSEEFGTLVSVQGSAQLYKPADYFKEGEWRTKKGGGPILINLIHEIGIMRELCGEIQQVFAFASNKVRQYEVEDTVSISLRFTSGCLGSFILSDCAASNKSWEMTSGENKVYPHYPDECCYHFAGTNGSLDFPNLVFKHYAKDTVPSWWNQFEHEASSVTFKDPLVEQLTHFLDVVEGKTQPIVNAHSGYKNMLILEAIQQSILNNKPIDI